VDAFLADNGYRRSDLQSWVLHTGGPKILEASATALGLHNGQLDASWDCLRKVGNLSSASVLVVLEDVMKNRRPEPGAMVCLPPWGPVLFRASASAVVAAQPGWRRLLPRRGSRRAKPRIDKRCGEALMPDATCVVPVPRLRALGCRTILHRIMIDVLPGLGSIRFGRGNHGDFQRGKLTIRKSVISLFCTTRCSGRERTIGYTPALRGCQLQPKVPPVICCKGPRYRNGSIVPRHAVHGHKPCGILYKE